jgi:hypothetical protein
MKKKISIIFIISILFIVIYYGVVRGGISYFTGFGTEYNYFKAKQATHDSILIFYSDCLERTICTFNIDSLALTYGFKTVYIGAKVSPFVLESYNQIIQDELCRRLGKRMTEYYAKVDSMNKKSLILYPNQ